jgi:hypothetical protein
VNNLEGPAPTCGVAGAAEREVELHEQATRALLDHPAVPMGELMLKLERHLHSHEGSLSILFLGDEFSAQYLFGVEAAGSSMVGGASYAAGRTAEECLRQIVEEVFR